jgi:hypothetical protein
MSGEMERLMGSDAPELVETYLAFRDFPLALLFESGDRILFLINFGALGEHLQDDSVRVGK